MEAITQINHWVRVRGGSVADMRRRRVWVMVICGAGELGGRRLGSGWGGPGFGALLDQRGGKGRVRVRPAWSRTGAGYQAGSSSLMASRSSLSSLMVPLIFSWLNSLSGTPVTISHWAPGRTAMGKLVIRSFSTP